MEEHLYYYKATVTSVYDGDTIRANIDFGFGFWREQASFRLARINTPEVRGDEKEEGIKARDALREKIDGQEIIIRTHKAGKYGRYLAEIYHEDKNINQWLVDNGYAQLHEY